MPQEKNKTLRRRLDRWEAQGEHQQIADAVLALPPEKREDWLLLRLAAAYNSLKEPEKALAGPLGAAVLQEAKELLDEQMELAVAYLREHERALEALSQALAERGYLDGAAFAEILQSFS